METVSDLIKALGGNTAFGRLCGFDVNPSARASDMRRRGSIPIRYWGRLVGAVAANGDVITLELLHSLHRESEAAA